MKLRPGASTPVSRWLALGLCLLVAAVVVAPLGLGFSHGICVGCEGGSAAPPGDFATIGCVACHGPSPGPHAAYANADNAGISISAKAPDGSFLNGVYKAKEHYTLTINFTETNHPEAPNHAGFNLRASAGKLSAVTGQSQVSGDGKQATHVDPTRTSWQVGWEAPDSGAAGFSLFINDVDGSGAPDEPDQVHWVQFGYADAEHSVLGAVKTEAVEFGISLQQYWIGLLGLAGMIFIMVAGFVYLKFVNPHNTDQKDR